MTDLSADLFSQVRQIKWLLVGLVILFGLFLFVLVSALRRLPVFRLETKLALEQQAFQRKLESLLAQCEYEQAKNLAKGRISVQPGDPAAHWYLGKCHYHSGSLASARASFLETERLDPSWRYRTKEWLEAVDKALAENSPSPVD